MVDFEHVHKLLDVVEKASAHGAAFGHIIQAARDELCKVNESLKPADLKASFIPEASIEAQIAKSPKGNRP